MTWSYPPAQCQRSDLRRVMKQVASSPHIILGSLIPKLSVLLMEAHQRVRARTNPDCDVSNLSARLAVCSTRLRSYPSLSNRDFHKKLEGPQNFLDQELSRDFQQKSACVHAALFVSRRLISMANYPHLLDSFDICGAPVPMTVTKGIAFQSRVLARAFY